MSREAYQPTAKARLACPKCGAALTAEAVLCVDCGYHLGHGKVLKTTDAREEARDQPRDPTRVWLFAAFGTAAVGAVVIGAAILVASQPPSIIGRWTGHASSEFHGLPVIGDEISLTFGSDRIVTSSDGASGRYAIKGNSIAMRLEKPGRGEGSYAFESKFKIERNWLTIENFPLSPKPMSFRREEDSTIEAPPGRFFPGPARTPAAGRGL